MQAGYDHGNDPTVIVFNLTPGGGGAPSHELVNDLGDGAVARVQLVVPDLIHALHANSRVRMPGVDITRLSRNSSKYPRGEHSA